MGPIRQLAHLVQYIFYPHTQPIKLNHRLPPISLQNLLPTTTTSATMDALKWIYGKQIQGYRNKSSSFDTIGLIDKCIFINKEEKRQNRHKDSGYQQSLWNSWRYKRSSPTTTTTFGFPACNWWCVDLSLHDMIRPNHVRSSFWFGISMGLVDE